MAPPRDSRISFPELDAPLRSRGSPIAAAREDDARISGTQVIDFRRAMEKMLGAGPFSVALARLSPAQRAEYEAVLPVSWLRVSTQEALTIAAADVAGRDLYAFHAEASRRSIEQTLNTLWRALMRITTDDALITRTTTIYAKTFDRGRLASKIPVPGRSEVTVSDWPTISELSLRGVAIGVETVLRIAGRRDVRVVSERRPDGAFYRATWRP